MGEDQSQKKTVKRERTIFEELKKKSVGSLPEIQTARPLPEIRQTTDVKPQSKKKKA